MWKENSLLTYCSKQKALVYILWYCRNYDTYEANLNYLPATKCLPINSVFHFPVENVEILLYPGKTKLTCTPNLGRGAKLSSCQIFKVTIWHNWQNLPWGHRNFHCKSQICQILTASRRNTEIIWQFQIFCCCFAVFKNFLSFLRHLFDGFLYIKLDHVIRFLKINLKTLRLIKSIDLDMSLIFARTFDLVNSIKP